MPILEEIKLIGEALIGVEKVVEGVVHALEGITAQSLPVLDEAQNLAINVLGALGQSTNDPLHLATINAHIGAIKADASLAGKILNDIGLIFSNFKSTSADPVKTSAPVPEKTEAKVTEVLISPTKVASTYTGGDS